MTQMTLKSLAKTRIKRKTIVVIETTVHIGVDQDELDMSYFYMTNDGFMKVMPIIEKQYLGTLKKLNIAGNALSDLAIIQLCDSLKQTHNKSLKELDISDNKSLEELDISDNKLSDEAIIAIADTLGTIRSLKTMIIEDLTDVSERALVKLRVALKKNEMALPDT